MKQVKNSFNLLSRLSDNFIPLLIILIVIPLFTLLVLGIYFIFAEGYILYFIGLLVFTSFLVFILHLITKQNTTTKQTLAEDEIDIEISPQWSEFDHENWKKLEKVIDNKLEVGIDWEEMQAYSFEVVSQAASYYHPENSEKELAFSASELLLALEEVSRRYRGYIIKYIPYENKINLSVFKQGYTHKDKLEKVKHIFNIYRATRLFNPAVALMSEIKGKITSHLFDNISNSLQNKIKRALLKDLASISIDLYRGHFKLRDCELYESKISIEDKTNQAIKIEPLRVVVVGQVSAGKSSVINAITNKMVVEVSVIPSTDKIAVHECKIDGMDVIKLIDLPGLDGNLETEKLIIKEMTESDLVFWVLKANQSARKLDTQLKTKFDEFYKKTENSTRKRPNILVLVNQVDKLQPIKEWNPPYDLINCHTSDKKACIIRDAVKFNQELLKPDNTLPLSLNPNLKFYNLGAVKEYLQTAYNNGINTQLNRRRHEHPDDGIVESSKKLYKFGKKLLFELE